MEYDIIGDVHGQAGKLEALLLKMGYRDVSGAWRHPTAQAIFVGDFIDRGPRQIDTVRIVRSMVESGSARAVMGNHELNAIGWVTPSLREPGEYLRQHQGRRGANNLHHHQEFLAQVGAGSALHQEFIDWFMTLPLWLDLPEIRVAHACYHPLAKQVASTHLGGAHLNAQTLHEVLDEASSPRLQRMDDMTLFEAVEILCKGVEVPLPGGSTYVDPVGYERSRVRSRWWDPDATSFRTCALLPELDKEQLSDEPIPDFCKVPHLSDKPVFFGHYWMKGTPHRLGPLIACVDYSAARSGPLVAYRYRGEAELSDANFMASQD